MHNINILLYLAYFTQIMNTLHSINLKNVHRIRTYRSSIKAKQNQLEQYYVGLLMAQMRSLTLTHSLHSLERTHSVTPCNV
jgi:hypothetical protein